MVVVVVVMFVCYCWVFFNWYKLNCKFFAELCKLYDFKETVKDNNNNNNKNNNKNNNITTKLFDKY